MTTPPQKTRARPAGGRAPQLPKLTLQKFDEAAQLLERMARENVTVFVRTQAEYLSAHRETSSRPLRPEEAVQLAAAAADAIDGDTSNLAGTAAQLQASDLRAYDEPAARDVLLAGGAATAPAFLALARRFTALIELPTEQFEQACEDDELGEALDERVKELDRLELDEARARATIAFALFAQKAGIGDPKGLLVTLWHTVLGAAAQAVQMSGLEASGLGSLISSAEPTAAASPGETSSTESPSTA